MMAPTGAHDYARRFRLAASAAIANASDKALHKEGNCVERFVSRIKHFRRIATRYDKLASTFIGCVTLAAIML
jgi:transposase